MPRTDKKYLRWTKVEKLKIHDLGLKCVSFLMDCFFFAVGLWKCKKIVNKFCPSEMTFIELTYFVDNLTPFQRPI